MGKRKVKFELDFGIIEGDQKRALQDYIDQRIFRQRKSYDEYVIDVSEIELTVDIVDLMIMADSCKVIVTGDNSVKLTDKD